MGFYPKAEDAKSVVKLDESVCASRIIEQMELGRGRATAIGAVLQGSHDVATFNAVWDKIEAERAALLAVKGKDATEYAAEVAKVAVYADGSKWVVEAEKAGLIASKVVETEKA